MEKFCSAGEEKRSNIPPKIFFKYSARFRLKLLPKGSPWPLGVWLATAGRLVALETAHYAQLIQLRMLLPPQPFIKSSLADAKHPTMTGFLMREYCRYFLLLCSRRPTAAACVTLSEWGTRQWWLWLSRVPFPGEHFRYGSFLRRTDVCFSPHRQGNRV